MSLFYPLQQTTLENPSKIMKIRKYTCNDWINWKRCDKKEEYEQLSFVRMFEVINILLQITGGIQIAQISDEELAVYAEESQIAIRE